MKKVISGLVYEVPENSSVELSLQVCQPYLAFSHDLISAQFEIQVSLVIGHVNIPGGKWTFRFLYSFTSALSDSPPSKHKAILRTKTHSLVGMQDRLQPNLFKCYEEGVFWSDEIHRELVLPIERLGWKKV